MEVAVETGLQRFYGKCANEQSGGTNGATFMPEDLIRALNAELNQPKCFPSFIKPSDVSVSTVAIIRGATNLLCVIQPWQTAKYGIDGTGNCRKVSEPEYQSWLHSPLNASGVNAPRP